MTRAKKHRSAAMMGAVAAGLLGAHASAASLSLTWDGNGVAPVGGGSGTWSTGAASWTADAGANYLAWNNLGQEGSEATPTPDNATFANTTGTVTLGSDIVASRITINSQSYVLSLNGFNLTTTGFGTTLVAASSINITNNSATTSTLTSAAFLTSGPEMTGNIHVVYTGPAWNPALTHTFTGGMSLLGSGEIRLDNVGLGTGQIRLGGTNSLYINTASGFAARTFDNDIELLNSTSFIRAGGTQWINLSGDITGTGQLKMTASQGGLVLSGNNSYSGDTFIVGASLSLIAASNTAFGNSALVAARTGAGGSDGVASTIGFTNGVNIGSTASLQFNGANPASGLGSIHSFAGDNTFAGNIWFQTNVARTVNVDDGGSLKLTGVISGNSATVGKGLTKMGEGKLILTGQNVAPKANASAGNETEVREGTLSLDFSQATWETSPNVQTNILNNGTNTDTSQATNQVSHLVLSGGTLEVIGKAGYTNTQNFKNATNDTAPTATNTFTIGAGGSAVRVVQNSATAVNIGLGKLFESLRAQGGTIDFTLPTTGTVLMQNTGTAGGTPTVGSANAILVANGAAFATVGGTNWAGLGASRNVVAGQNITNFYSASTANTLANNADVSAGVDTTLEGDTGITSLRFHNSGGRSINLGGFNLSTSGILVSNTGNTGSTITGGTLRGNISATGNLQDLPIFQNNTAAKLVIGAAISNASNTNATALTKTGAGTVELTAANGYTGTTFVTGGSLVLNHANALGTGNLTLHGGVIGLTAATVDGNGRHFTRALGTGAGAIRFLGSGGFAAYGGDRIVNIGNATGTFNWGNNTASSIPTGSNLILGAPDATGTLIFQNPINLANSTGSPVFRTIQVENGSANIDARLTGALSSGYANLVKTGTGTLELSATNTWSGAATVKQGRLLLTGSMVAGAPVTVQNGGTFGGTGNALGSVTAEAGGRIAPGISGVGTLSTGSLTLSSASTMYAEIDFASQTSDKIVVTGTVALNGASLFIDLQNGQLFPGALKTYTLIDNNGTADAITGAGFNIFSNAGSKFAYSLSSGDNNDYVITVNSVPEPASLGLLALGAGALLRRRRRFF